MSEESNHSPFTRSPIVIGADDNDDFQEEEEDLTPVARNHRIPSRFAKVKSELTKHYIESHFADIMRERQERSRFHESLYNNSKLSNDQRAMLESQYAKNSSNIRRLKRRNLRPSQFEKIKMIGRGAFGDVWLVRDKEDNNFYAMKMLRKSELIAKKQVINTLSERDIMASDNPWSVQLIYSFQDSTYLYFVMEYLPGGDLMNLLIKRGFLSEEESRFILAETLLAIQNVHQSGFIHRDVKPDNILITRTGHIKLTDFGLSAKTERYADPYMSLIEDVNDLFHGSRAPRSSTPQMNPMSPMNTPGFAANQGQGGSTTNAQIPRSRREALCSTVGTPDYIAPEVLLKKPYDNRVDFWSFGAMMYEMLFGSPPFFAKTARQTAINIVKWRETLKFPRKPPVTMAAIDLIRHLLCGRDHRIGFEEIKRHPFFNGIDFDNLQNLTPPIVPEINNDADTSNFEEFVPREETHDHADAADEVMNLAFLGFKYNRHLKTRTLPCVSPAIGESLAPILNENIQRFPPPIPPPSQPVKHTPILPTIQPSQPPPPQYSNQTTLGGHPQPPPEQPSQDEQEMQKQKIDQLQASFAQAQQQFEMATKSSDVNGMQGFSFGGARNGNGNVMSLGGHIVNDVSRPGGHPDSYFGSNESSYQFANQEDPFSDGVIISGNTHQQQFGQQPSPGGHFQQAPSPNPSGQPFLFGGQHQPLNLFGTTGPYARNSQPPFGGFQGPFVKASPFQFGLSSYSTQQQQQQQGQTGNFQHQSSGEPTRLGGHRDPPKSDFAFNFNAAVSTPDSQVVMQQNEIQQPTFTFNFGGTETQVPIQEKQNEQPPQEKQQPVEVTQDATGIINEIIIDEQKTDNELVVIT
ncbi:hypothetical protein TRFO_30853 [Tritrichomonas foetus]|uniref:non-specific serine/threonine protein kinase n=1 Tax=Tritrichomonas foetus TaxID=1144522 RepID=A0A1J4JX87_9EUKA|nr:hypothetical protein TRFO_30853 [Tritrichomonas foetus]|eukprot:OHT02150.1 hypothetical protein TRFO_30853 [Tritrichomonas foetus]